MGRILLPRRLPPLLGAGVMRRGHAFGNRSATLTPLDGLILTEGQKSEIRLWTQMIRTADEEFAVTFLTRLILNLAENQMALDAALEATKNQPKH